MKFDDFLTFDKMITPVIIKIIYYFLVIASIFGGIVFIVQGISAPWGGGMMVFSGLLTLIFGPIWSRVFCELMIVSFRIYARLSSIDENIKKKSNI
ncbi:DUF4282 domain-containing protein [Emticicia sp. 17c]|uniref:DUF4282 domain-containing protein n=1 Tax=Emticicia sp. 17c TaxID=3127704 RepID=UPI00301D5723